MSSSSSIPRLSSPLDAASMPVQTGDVLAGKYVVERVIAVGGMGTVVAAIHRSLGGRVALKFMLRSLAASPAVVRRFTKEARAARAITSEHVVRVIDIGTLDGGEPYIVMEYLEGRDLADEIARGGPLRVDVAIDYVMQALQAIAEAHAKGIVHRDLKPSNLFLTHRADGTPLVKVLDFGIAKARATSLSATLGAGDTSGSMPLVGSPHYMSPEQIRSSRDVDMRSDVWSIGVILYELLTGRPPFRADEVGGVLAAVLTERVEPLRDHRPELPTELERIVLACLEKDADRRTKSVADLGAALAPFGSADARLSLARIRGISGGAAAPVSRQRSRLAATFAALVAVFVMSVAGVIVVRRSRAIAPERPHANSAVVGGAVAAPAPQPSAEPPAPARVSESRTATTAQPESIEPRKRAVPAMHPGAALRRPSPSSGAGPDKRRRRDIDALFEERR